MDYQIMRHIGTLNKKGCEVNIIAWHGGEPKLDIRCWFNDHEKCGKGLTLRLDEIDRLCELLQNYLKERDEA